MKTISCDTRNVTVTGIIGHPINHSLSPSLHNYIFAELGLKYIYLPFDVPLQNLKNALKGFVALGVKGFNVTLPHKEIISQYLSDVSEEAGIIGAVNTVINNSGNLVGYNTDVHGIIESLLPFEKEIKDETALVIGAGGAARAVIYSLIRRFKVGKIILVNRTQQKTESLKEYFSAKMKFYNFKTFELIPPDLTEIFADSKLIINSSSIGMFPNIDDSPTLIEESFNKNQIVFDVVYTPVNTRLLQIAQKQGARTITGIKMFLEQAAASFELWAEEKMPKEKAELHLTKLIESEEKS